MIGSAHLLLSDYPAQWSMQANRHRQVVQARTSNGMCRKAVWIGDCPVVDGQWTVSIWADIWQLVSERQSRAIWCWKHTTQMWPYVQEIFSVVSKADIKCRWSPPTYIKILWWSFLKYENWISQRLKNFPRSLTEANLQTPSGPVFLSETISLLEKLGVRAQ